MTFNLVAFTALGVAVLLPSCAQTQSQSDAVVKTSPASSKPTLLKLNSFKSDQKEVKLRWKAATPEMDMTRTNSGDGWATGSLQSPGVYVFAQNKFYALTLDFNKGTFIENGFDGAPLPEVRGSWSALAN